MVLCVLFLHKTRWQYAVIIIVITALSVFENVLEDISHMYRNIKAKNKICIVLCTFMRYFHFCKLQTVKRTGSNSNIHAKEGVQDLFLSEPTYVP